VSATPTKNCNVSSLAMKLFGSTKIWLVDCGEGTQHQLIKRPDLVKSSKIEVIFITHLHGDHCFGLPGLLASLSLTGVVTSLKVVGPEGIKTMIETNISLSKTYLTYKLEIIELVPEKITNLGKISDIEVSAYPLVHKDVACFGFVFQEPEKPGQLDGKKAAQLGAKGKDLGLLKSGKDIVLPNGDTLKASDVLSPPQKGKKVLVLGDTKNSDSMFEVGQNCDLLIHEATYDHSMHTKALEGGHSTAKMAGQFAKSLKAKNLIINHFSKRYLEGDKSDNKDENNKSVSDLVVEAQSEVDSGVTVRSAAEFASFSI